MEDKNHPKLEAFQKAVESALLKRLESADEELSDLKKQRLNLKNERITKTKELHQAQSLLNKEEKKLESINKDLIKKSKQREEIENENIEMNKGLHTQLRDLETKRLLKMELQDKYNKLLHKQILMESQRVHMAGEVNSGQNHALKLEKDLKNMTTTKKAQDLYLDKLIEQLESLESSINEYQVQSDSMKKQTLELEELLRKSEKDTQDVIKEKRNIMQEWTLAVINISKRDETISGFYEGLKEKELERKGILNEIEYTKSEIVNCQEQHDHLSNLEQRHSKQHELYLESIQKTEKKINESELQLVTVHNSKKATLVTLENTNSEINKIERENNDLRDEINKLKDAKREISDEILVLLQDKTISNKQSRYADKTVRELREQTHLLENKFSETQNQLSGILQDILQSASELDENKKNKDELLDKVNLLSSDMENFENKLIKSQGALDKKQHLIEIRVKQKKDLLEKNPELTPLEAEIERYKEEIKNVRDYNESAKKTWIKHQNDFIKKLDQRDQIKVNLMEESRKYSILNEKKMKIDVDICTMESSIIEIKRKIEARDDAIQRINRTIFEEKTRYENTVKTMEGKRAIDVNKMTQMTEEIEALKDCIADLDDEIINEKVKLTESDSDLSSWEERIKACKETQAVVQLEKSTELEDLKSEVHRLTVRLDHVDKYTKTLMENIQSTVNKRESLVDKVEAANKINPNKARVAKTLANKKIDDMRNKLKKMNKKIENLNEEISSEEKRDIEIQKELDRNLSAVEKINENIGVLNQRLEEGFENKDHKMNYLLELQSRVKWYEAILAGKYKLCRKGDDDDETTQNLINRINRQNLDLRDCLISMIDTFPYLKRTLRKAAINLSD